MTGELLFDLLRVAYPHWHEWKRQQPAVQQTFNVAAGVFRFPLEPPQAGTTEVDQLLYRITANQRIWQTERALLTQRIDTLTQANASMMHRLGVAEAPWPRPRPINRFGGLDSVWKLKKTADQPPLTTIEILTLHEPAEADWDDFRGEAVADAGQLPLRYTPFALMDAPALMMISRRFYR